MSPVSLLNLLTCVAITCHVDLSLYPADGLVVREEILVYRLLLSLDLSHMVPQSLQTIAHLRGRGGGGGGGGEIKSSIRPQAVHKKE